MQIYFYHTRLTAESLAQWRKHQFPGHLLYGLPLLERYGIGSILHRYRPQRNRLCLMCYVAWEILTCRKPFDAIYATSFYGLELLIFLRAVGLWRKPIVVWHHTALQESPNWLHRCLARLFYRGIDHAFFFSDRLIADSLPTGKLRAAQLQKIHWGPDLDFYDHLTTTAAPSCRRGFISTGKERRDMDTLLQAFAALKDPLTVYITAECGGIDYKKIISGYALPENITVHFTQGVIPHRLAQEVAQCAGVVICCLPSSYTVGLTTLVEAMALGLPIICTQNPYFDVDIVASGIGIAVKEGDVKGWQRAVQYLTAHPDEARAMGLRSRALAEEKYNLEIFSSEVARALRRLQP